MEWGSASFYVISVALVLITFVLSNIALRLHNKGGYCEGNIVATVFAIISFLLSSLFLAIGLAC